MRAQVMDLTGRGRGTTLEVVVSTAVELLIQLDTFGSEGLQPIESFEAGRAWFDQIRTKLSADLSADLERIGPQGGAEWGKLMGLALHEPGARDAAAFLQLLEAMPAHDLWLAFFGYHIGPFRAQVGEERFRRAAAGSEADARAIIEAERRFEPEHRALGGSIAGRTPVEAKADLLRALRGWYREVFLTDAEHVGSVLERDAAAKRSKAASMSEDALFEAATNGLELHREPWMHRIVLVPQIAMRPWNILSAHDDLGIFCYPVSDEFLGGEQTAPPAGTVRLFKALGDDKRLRMLRRLASGPATLQELAEVVGLAKSSAHHHTVILRAAGLIRVSAEQDSRYTLRRETLPEASGLLAAYVEGTT